MGVLTQPLYEMPTRHELEDKAIVLLREFYTIDDEIEVQREMANGDNLPFESRTTAFLRHDEDNEEILWKMHVEALSEGQETIVNTVMRYVDTSKVTYATIQRVERLVSRLSADTQHEQEIIDMFAVMLREAAGEPDDTRLNDIEMLVERRWRLIDRARNELKRLEKNKKYIGQALSRVQDKFPDSFQFLKYKYIQLREQKDVNALMGIMSEKEYRIIRDNAIERFMLRCPRLEELECGRNDAKHKPGRVRV